MTLGSKTENNAKKYYFELTEAEFNQLVYGDEKIVKFVESAKGRGIFTLQFVKNSS